MSEFAHIGRLLLALGIGLAFSACAGVKKQEYTVCGQLSPAVISKVPTPTVVDAVDAKPSWQPWIAEHRIDAWRDEKSVCQIRIESAVVPDLSSMLGPMGSLLKDAPLAIAVP